MDKGKLYGIGVGPGDPSLLTLKAVETINKCRVIATPQSGAGDNVALSIVKAKVDLKDKNIIELDLPMIRDKEKLYESHITAAKKVIEILDSGQDIGFLTLGDPSIYSTYGYIHNIVKSLSYDVEIIPGITSFCAAASSLNSILVLGNEPLHIMPMSHRDSSEIESLHGCKILMKSGKGMKKLINDINSNGDSEINIVERASMDKQRVFRNIKRLEDDLSYFSLVVIKDGIK
ncbi:MAG: precorrin-2 C(20)-methyltransferase [Clostridium sp.]